MWRSYPCRVSRHVEPGSIIVLNGSSSSGKTTLAQSLQRLLAKAGQPWVIFGWDDFMPRLPLRWHAGPDAAGDRAAEGCSYRVVRDEPFEALLEMGDVGQRMLAGYHRAIAAIAR